MWNKSIQWNTVRFRGGTSSNKRPLVTTNIGEQPDEKKLRAEEEKEIEDGEIFEDVVAIETDKTTNNDVDKAA